MPHDDLADQETGPIPRIPAEPDDHETPASHRAPATRTPARRTPASATRTRPGKRPAPAGRTREHAPAHRRANKPGDEHGNGKATHEQGPSGNGQNHRWRQGLGQKRGQSQGPGHGHGHGHGHGPAAPASRRVRLLLAWLLIPVAVLTVAAGLWLYPWGKPKPAGDTGGGTPVDGTITTAQAGPCLAPGQVHVGDPGTGKPCLTVDIALTDGDAAGSRIKLTVPVEPSTPRFTAGDDVVLAYNGGDPRDAASYQLVDFQRGFPLVLLAGLFAIAVVLLGRWQGLAALAALGLSFAVLVLFVLPAILGGQNPLLVAIVGSGVIMFAALYLTHGVSARTSVAVLGTMVSLALIGILSAIFSAAAALTGLDDGTNTLIASLGHGIDARGLLLAGIVIGALGVLDDVTVTQTSAVWELRRANPSMSWRELYRSALRIGRDHVGSAVNTLVMAYAGAALPVLLYSSLSGVGLGAILSSGDIAEEIVRTLTGSIGIIAAVPVTTALAALIASQDDLTSTTSHSSKQASRR